MFIYRYINIYIYACAAPPIFFYLLSVSMFRKPGSGQYAVIPDIVDFVVPANSKQIHESSSISMYFQPFSILNVEPSQSFTIHDISQNPFALALPIFPHEGWR